jgi:hypothetical protein
MRLAFQDSLNLAIAHGSRASDRTGLGRQTLAAIDVVASEHPDASADDIAYAYEVFEREHGQRLMAS